MYMSSARVPGAFDNFLEALIQFLNKLPEFRKTIGEDPSQR